MDCVYHPGREAIAGCIRCQKLICEDCKTVIEGQMYCKFCADEILAAEKAKEIYKQTEGDTLASSSISKTARKTEKQEELTTKKIKETQCTCSVCGHTWFYGKQEVLEQTSATMENLGKSMACCTGCLPAIFIPDKKVIDLNKCPKCGSKAIKKEEVIHEV